MIKIENIDIEDYINPELVFNQYKGFTKIVAGRDIKRGQLLFVLKSNFKVKTVNTKDN